MNDWTALDIIQWAVVGAGGLVLGCMLLLALAFRTLARQALHALWRTRLRVFFTTLGVTIGIAALVLMVGVGINLERSLIEAVAGDETFTTVTVFGAPAGSFGSGGGRDGGTFKLLSNADVETIGDIPEVVVAWPTVNVFPTLRFPEEMGGDEDSTFRPSQVTGVPPDYPIANPEDRFLAGGMPAEGTEQMVLSWNDYTRVLRHLDREMPDDVTAGALDGEEAEALRLAWHREQAQDLIGRPITRRIRLQDGWDEAEATIAGVLRPGQRVAVGLASIGGGATYWPVDTVLDWVERGAWTEESRMSMGDTHDDEADPAERGRYMMVTALVDDPRNVGLVKQAVADAIDRETVTAEDVISQMRLVFLIVDGFLGAVGAIALLVASLGIINTMVMSIMQRRGEIGLMKALGARDRDVGTVFFLEAGMIGVLGGVLGVLFGLGCGALLEWGVNTFFLSGRVGADPITIVRITWPLGLSAVAFSTMVAMIAGLYPAWRAARVDPVDALRSE